MPATVSEAAPVPFLVSAPGKVILFGEHLAVYGKPAIAAALLLRTYLLVSPPLAPRTVQLDFPDIGFTHRWDVDTLPWGVLAAAKEARQHPAHEPMLTEELIPELVLELAGPLAAIQLPTQYAAAYAFLYLFVSLATPGTGGMSVCVRLTLPIGAGLGLLALVLVCIAAALATHYGHVPAAAVRNAALATLLAHAAFIDNWLFMGEKCLHGNPLGIDNTVASYGGAVMFQKTSSLLPLVRTTMRNFPALKLVLSNTQQLRRTAALVAGVLQLNQEHPKTTLAILLAMEHLANEAYSLMVRPMFGPEARSELHELVRINHGLLVALGVLHPKLERVKLYADEAGAGLTKLTGAGGGGCAITLVGEDTSEDTIAEFTAKLEQEGFETFETTLGGKGVGILVGADTHVYDRAAFLEYGSRAAIEAGVGVGSHHGWRYW